jgi:ATP-independent RNA helicase DbpA
LTQPGFATLALPPDVLKNLASLGYEAMTPIQALALPPVLTGADVIGQAMTGSGKTVAFGLGLLARLDVSTARVQALVLCPTRELADQVARAIRDLARTTPNVKVLTLCGGSPLAPQAASLAHGAHVIVGTPGRIEDHLRKGTLRLGGVQTLVLDEADRMLDMGFQAALEAIVGHTPARRQTLLFSATYPDAIRVIAQRLMREPLLVAAAGAHDDASIEQHFFEVADDSQRLTALRLLLLRYRPASAVVFCNTRRDTQAVADALRGCDFSVLALHGDLEQRDRDSVLVRFANGSASVLVATDVAARGLDIEALDAVINFQAAPDPEVHVHRIGRTGRAGGHGLALTLYSAAERYRIERLAAYLQRPIDSEPLPPESLLDSRPAPPAMVTLQLDAGRKRKVRPGDVLGALTGEGGVAGAQVGKIQIFDHCAYVAVNREAAAAALSKLTRSKLKGRAFRVRRVGDAGRAPGSRPAGFSRRRP